MNKDNLNKMLIEMSNDKIFSEPNNKNKVIYKKDGVYYITLSYSLLNQMYYKGNEENCCFKKIYETYMTKNYESITTEKMLYGLYFESQCLGRSKDRVYDDLPRKNITKKQIQEYIKAGIPEEQWIGEKTAAHKRIDEQIQVFKNLSKQCGFIIDDVNVQRSIKISLDVSRYFNNVNVIISITPDLITPATIDDVYYDTCCIDLKLTGDRFGGFGKYNWGNVQYMDHTQINLYGMVTGLPQFYLLFDYKTIGMGYRFIKRSLESQEYQNDLIELKETLRKAIEKLIWLEENGYEETPSEDNCRLCPLNPIHGGNCIKKINVTEI